MDTVLPIVLLMFLICFIGNTNGIRCYNCLADCSDPFNKTNANIDPLESPTGWCIKFKASKDRETLVIRSFDPLGLCTENKCASGYHNDIKETRCCCDTELCNNSNTISKSLSSFIGLAFLAGMSLIFNY